MGPDTRERDSVSASADLRCERVWWSREVAAVVFFDCCIAVGVVCM